MWKVFYSNHIKKDFKKIPSKDKISIMKAIETKLMIDPFKNGVPLRKNLMGLMKLRVGNYRVIYSIKDKNIEVYVIKIGHRREIYRDIIKLDR